MNFVKNVSASLALMAVIGTASAIPVTDLIDPSPDVTISVGNPYTFIHDITDGYVATYDNLVSALLTISLIDNESKDKETFQFAIGGNGAVLQLYNDEDIPNGNSVTAFPIALAAALGDLSADGLLSVTLSASAGDYLFSSSFLSAEITRGGDSDSDQVAAAAVPEPGTLALLGLGFVGMSLIRKRRG